MRIIATAVLAALACGLFDLSAAHAQQCPVGSTPWVDNWGNRICRRTDGSTATTEVPHGQTCPIGAFPTVDNWGNKVCRSQGTPNQPRTDYYDTSKGCPVGTHEWVDSWGNKVCKPF